MEHKRLGHVPQTCGAEQESLRTSQVLVHLVGDGHLSVGEGAESLLVGGAHFCLNVIKEQREGTAAELLHLKKSQTRRHVLALWIRVTRVHAPSSILQPALLLGVPH